MKNGIILTLSFLVSLSGLAQSDLADLSRWTPEDIIHTEYMQSVTISSDNKMVAWTKRRGLSDKDKKKNKDKFVSDIYLTRLDMEKDGEFKTIRLTNQDENDHSPLFSRDSEKLYFLSSREKGKKLWSLNLLGGEPSEVHEFKNGISDLDWLNDTTLIFSSNEGKTLYEQQLEDQKDNVVVVEDSIHWKADRLYAFNIKDKSISRLTDNEKPIGSYGVSRNGEWLVYSMTMSRHYAADQKPDPQYFLKNTTNNTAIRILTDRNFPSGNFQFSPDNQGFYFLSDTASDPEWNGSGLTELYYYTLASKSYAKVSLDWDMGIGGGIAVAKNGIYVSLANKTYHRLAFYEKTPAGWSKREIDLADRNDHIKLLAISDDGSKIIFDYSTASKLPQYYVGDANGGDINADRPIITLNEKLQKKPTVRSEVISWAGYQGGEVTGILYYPENYESAKKYPFVLSIHGGPAGVDTDTWRERWSTYPNILAQRGAFVLKPNYHGSSNHGLAFVETIKGNYYEPEMVDITNAIELLATEGKIDKNKMGVMGWSNGAIIATMLTVRYPDMFKVACPGAGDVNWTSDFGTCRFGVNFDQSYFGGAPWDDVDGKFYNEKYILKSPLFELEKVKTPTIIFHGSEDRAVPRDQGWEYYRALQQANQTPVRFLWFPGQPHGLGKITHQLRKMKEELKWIDKYLFDNDIEDNEAFKKDSPLAALLKKNDLQKVGSNFGYPFKHKLLPQTKDLKKDSLSIGILEITNAQFQAFQSDHSFESDRANFPAIVSFDQAKAYVGWLSNLTGHNYRLPNSTEAKAWHQLAHKNAARENTLNYWAGYKITKDEISLLMQKVNGMKEGFIKSVASHKPIKYEALDIYDVGGNVAEYDDSGKAYGYDALDFVDPHDPKIPDSANVGFRVVQDLKP